MFLGNKYKTLTKNSIPGTLSCSCKARKSIKMSTSVGKKEHCFSRILPSGSFLIVIDDEVILELKTLMTKSIC